MTKEAYIDEKYRTYLHEWVGTALLAGALFLLAPIALDYLAAPEHFRTFLAYRIAAFSVLCTLGVLNRRRVDTRYQIVLTLLALVTVAVMLSAMVVKFRGHQSPYAMGIIVLAIFALGFVPLPVR